MTPGELTRDPRARRAAVEARRRGLDIVGLAVSDGTEPLELGVHLEPLGIERACEV